MNRDDLAFWLARMEVSQNEGARLLRCSKNSMTAWMTGRNDIPHVVALACSAIIENLKPFERPTPPLPQRKRKS